MKTCPDCNGDGVVDKGTDNEQRCPRCGGSGFVPDNDGDDDDGVIRTCVLRPPPLGESAPAGRGGGQGRI
jgi:hypothetical protein